MVRVLAILGQRIEQVGFYWTLIVSFARQLNFFRDDKGNVPVFIGGHHRQLFPLASEARAIVSENSFPGLAFASPAVELFSTCGQCGRGIVFYLKNYPSVCKLACLQNFPSLSGVFISQRLLLRSSGVLMMSNFKTFSLLVLLSGIILLLGRFLGGANGLLFAFILALLMNAGSYWFSDKIVLAAYKAQPLQASDAPSLYRMLEDLSEAAQIPCPRLYLIPDSSPNAFATGRNPAHAVVAVTQGLMQLLSPDELRGVLAHEIAHIRNRDIFLQSVVAVLATIIMYAAHILQWKAIFGGGSSENSNGNSGGVAGALLLAILAPLAAALIQFAISRSREFQADKVGAEISKAPLALASALDKLARCAQRAPLHNAGQGTAHLFIVNPLGKGLRELFSTHPPVQERIRRLHAMSGQGPKIL